jgi:beta-glucosidase
MQTAAANGDIPQARIDDAVRRILAVKFELGLFEHPYPKLDTLAQVGSDAHRAVARQAVQKSLVLLKNDPKTLPLSKDTPLIFVAGQAADDIGMQSGGWTIEWQGKTGAIDPGTTILGGIQAAVKPGGTVLYDRSGQFDNAVDAKGKKVSVADVGIVVVGEQPYAEGVGDSSDPGLSSVDAALIDKLRPLSKKLVVVIVSGRPLVITPQLSKIDALVAAWLPGSEGQGVADALFGDVPFSGKLSYSWERTNSQLPINVNNLGSKTGCDAPLFPFGFGLGTDDPPVPIPNCP